MAKASTRTAAVSKSSSEMKKTTLLHPPYIQMITEAIASLKDRTGSSQPAIAKFIDEKYGSGLPSNFKKVLSVQLKKFSKSERLVKVKNSYKISATEKVKSVSSVVDQANREKKKKASGDTSTVKMDKKEIVKVKKVRKTKEAVTVSSPEKKKKPLNTLKPKALTKKVKRLSQVKTPEGMKKKRAPTPWRASKSTKGSKAVPQKA